MDSNLKTELTADASQASSEVKKFGNELTQFEKKAASLNRLNFSSGYGQQGARLMEFARGLEDFTVGFQTGGLAGALRGATNNAATFAATLGPMAALYTTLASVGAMTLIPHLERLMESFDDSEKKAKAFKESLENLEKIRAFSGMKAKIELDVEFFKGDLSEKMKTATSETIREMRETLKRQAKTNTLELNEALRSAIMPSPEVEAFGDTFGTIRARARSETSRNMLKSMFPSADPQMVESIIKGGKGAESARVGSLPTKAELQQRIKDAGKAEAAIHIDRGTPDVAGALERRAQLRAERFALEKDLELYDRMEKANKKINELIVKRDSILRNQAELDRAPIPLRSPLVEGDMRLGSQGLFDVLDRLMDPTPRTDEQISVLRQMLTNLEESKNVLSGIKDEVAKRVAVGRLN